MINITFKPNVYELKINGHADYSKGETDVVCAATSILIYTLCESLMLDRAMLKEDPIFVFENGNGYVCCEPIGDFEATIARTYKTIINGYQLLADSYPNNVKLKIKDAYKKEK